MKKFVVPLVNLRKQYQNIRPEIEREIQDVLNTMELIGGSKIAAFEQQLAKHCQVHNVVSMNSGTDALYAALWALDIGPGDEVITTPFTFFASVEAIMRCRARPVFVDIEPDTFLINLDLVEAKISPKTKAILPVDLFGLPVAATALHALARHHRLYIIEDACQAIGAISDHYVAGSIGDLGCLSFFPSKNLGAFGDGGAVITDNEDWANAIRMFRNHGAYQKYNNIFMGTNSRLDAIQAAVLLAKLPHLETWNNRRQHIAKQYTKHFAALDFLIAPSTTYKNRTHIFHQYTLRIKNGQRDALRIHLQKHGIATMIYYPIALHCLPALQSFGYEAYDFPEAKLASQEVLSIPMYPEMTDQQIQYVIGCVTAFAPKT